MLVLPGELPARVIHPGCLSPLLLRRDPGAVDLFAELLGHFGRHPYDREVVPGQRINIQK
jgi:hypothetical protein